MTTECCHCHAEEPDHAPDDCPMCKGIQYVNAYAVSRCYGGPEEGGWWYDAGMPLASVPIGPDDDPEPVIESLKKLIGWPVGPTHQGRYSVLGEDDFEVYVQRHFAKPFPERTPHYE